MLRRQQKFTEARKQLLVCAGELCPALARTDCVQWLSEVEGALPSVVFEAKAQGEAVFDVSVTIDGAPAASHLDGRPVDLDPGIHTFTFTRPGSASIEERVIIREGEKNKPIQAEWSPPPRAAVPGRVPTSRPIPPSALVAAGVGVLGLADFAAAGAVGLSMRSSLQSSGCSPFCSPSRVREIKTTFAVGDVGLAVGAGAFVTSAILLLTRPEVPRASPAVGRLHVDPTSSGMSVGYDGFF